MTVSKMWALRADQVWGRVVAVALAAAFVAGCTSVGRNSPTAAVFGAEAPGAATPGVDTQEHSRIVAAYGGIYHDAKVEQTLVPIVSRIVASSDRPDQAYRITIL